MKTATRIMAFFLAAALLLLVPAGCGVDRGRVCGELWKLSREQLASLESRDTAGVWRLLHTIDSLQQLGAQVPDTAAMGVALDVGYYLSRAQDYGRTIHYVYTAHQLLERLITHELPMQSNLIGLNAWAHESFHEMGLNDRAVQGYLKDLPVAKRLNLKEGLAFIYNNLGSVYIDMGNYSDAITMLRESIKWNLELNDSSFLAYNYNNLSTALLKDGQYDKAIEYGFLALHYVNPADTLTAMLMRRNLAGRYNEGGEYAAATKQLAPALRYFETHDVNHELARTYKELAFAQWKTGDLKQARANYDRAFDCAGYCTPLRRMVVVKDYAQFCDSIGDRDRQCKALNYCLQLTDTVAHTGNNKWGETVTGLYQQEVERGDANNKIFEQSRRELLWYIAILGTLLAVVLIVGVMLWHRNRRRRAEDRCSLDALEQELMTAAVDNEKNEALVASLNRELQSLQRVMRAGSHADAMTALQRVTTRVMQADKQVDSQPMATVNADFYKRLLERFPQLTQNDLRLCALLRQGMSSKEIAAVTGKEVRSVETARNRLRKKCGIDPAQDLFKFLLAI